jgi:hypothetical protein
VGPVKLDAVMDEVAATLSKITGLRVTAYPPESVVPPAGYVSYPESVNFDEAYGRGEDKITDLPIVLLASRVTTRAARDTAAAWASGDGPKSVKAALEAHTWRTCDDLTVTSCEFDVERIANVSYLAVMFRATVVGPGEE